VRDFLLKFSTEMLIRTMNGTLTHNVMRLGVCYFALQIFQALDKFNRQNNSTKPLLYAGGGWLNEN
jgi:hypothetical protein